MSKLLQVIGALAILAFTGAGVGAWMLTKEQVHVTFEEGAGERRAADPTAELADRIDALQEDLRGLARTLGQNFEVLDGAAAERAEAAATANTEMQGALRRELAEHANGFEARLVRALAAERERGAAELAALREELALLRRELATAGASTVEPELPASEPLVAGDPAAPPAGAIDPNAQSSGDAGAESGARSEAAAGDVAKAPESREAAPKKKRSFVAFELPSDALKFDGRRTWEIVPSLSRVGFDAKSTLHDFTGATRTLTGEWTCDLAHPEVEPRGSISVDAASLDTGLLDRNTAMHEKLETAKHAAIAFEVLSFRATSSDAKAMKVAGVVRGKLQVRGVAQEIEMPVNLAVDSARRLTVDGEAHVKMSAFGIEPPSQLGMISVQDQVKIWIALRARVSSTGNR